MLLWTLEKCVYFWISGWYIYIYIHPGVNLLGHIVVLFLVFWKVYILFSTVVSPIYIPTNSVQRFPFLYILINVYLCYFRWWMDKPFWQVWGDIPLWFWFAFPWWLGMLSIFSCVCWPSEFSLWKNVYSVHLPPFKWCFLLMLSWVSIHICWILTLYSSYHFQIF